MTEPTSYLQELRRHIADVWDEWVHETPFRRLASRVAWWVVTAPWVVAYLGIVAAVTFWDRWRDRR